MAQTVASFSTAVSSNMFYHVFINHRGADVKKTFASHLYHRLCSARIGLKVFLDQPELQVGSNFGSQIKDAIRTASVHVAIFSPRYAESEWCLNELLYMLESKALIIPVFYHVDPAVVRWPEGKGAYAEDIRILEKKKARDPETHEDLEKPRYDPATIKKWRDALSTVSNISGLDLNAALYNGDEGAVVEKIVQLVLKEIKSESFDLNSPKEFLTKISGRLGKYGPHEVVICMTFHTNQRVHGPRGVDAGGYFDTEEGKIVGMFGSSGHLLDSIGVYMLKPRSLEDDLTESDLSESD